MLRKRFLFTKPKRLLGLTLLVGIGVIAAFAAKSEELVCELCEV